MVSRIRLAVGLLSFTVIGFELALMRILSLGFWYYFAAMVISVALLGFGFSGTLLTLAQRRLTAQRGFWLPALCFGTSLSILICAAGVQHVPLDVHYLAWNPGAQWRHILAIELLMLLPFLLSGGFLGLVLMDRSSRISGHYAANLVGSGAGALVSLVLMSYVTIPGLLFVLALLSFSAGAALTSWTNRRAVAGAVAVAAIGLAAMKFFPTEIRISPYKKLTLERLKPQTEVIHTAHGPLGRIDIMQGRSIHDAPPGMSLHNPHPIPPRSLVIVDGDQANIVYNYESKKDLQFLNYTSAAVAFTVGRPARVLVIGPGGGAYLALAHLNAVEEIDAVAANRQMVELIRSQLADKGGDVYRLPGVRTYFESPRGYLRRTEARYDLILLPLLDAAGAGGAGLQAAQENYLFTVQSLGGFIRHLTEKGLICVTVRAKTPPRDGLRSFNTAITALRQEGLSPADRLALIRSWETVTLVAQKKPWTASQLANIHDFCSNRGFDICYLPGLGPEAVNRFHILSRSDYYEGARELLGGHRQRYIQNYLFALEAPTDDRPYFDHLYSAAAVIAAFLMFAGIGSLLSARCEHGAPAAVRTAAALVTVMGLGYLLWLDSWLALTQSWELLPRLAMTILTIAPLALAMGHLFPLGLRRVAEAAPALAPWCWAANGFASVLATVSAPLLAMSVGFSKLILAAIVCYLAAGLLFSHLPQRYAAN